VTPAVSSSFMTPKMLAVSGDSARHSARACIQVSRAPCLP
jgi:hypothetical protein